MYAGHETSNIVPSIPYRYLLAGSLVAALLLTTIVARPANPDLWAQAVFDWLHVPVFGIIAVCSFVMTPSTWRLRYRLLVAATATFALGLLTESAQTLQPNRSASAHDLLNDMLGAAAFLALLTALAPGLPLSRPVRVSLVLVSAGLVGWSLTQPAKVFPAYIDRYRHVPSIAPINSRKSRLFFDLRNTIVRYTNGPEEGTVEPEFLFGEDGSASIDFHDPWPDWSGREALVLEISNMESTPLSLTLRIHDREHLRGNQPGSDRFRSNLTIPPGRHALTFPMDVIENAPTTRKMDLTRIDGLIIYRSGQGSSRRFRIHDIRLE